MRKLAALSCFVLVVLGVATACRTEPSPQPDGLLTIEDLIEIKHPSVPTFSSDGRIAFIWDRAGVQNVWIGDTDGTSGSPTARPLTSFESGLINGLFWSQDGQTFYFGHNGDLWQVSPDGSQQPRETWTTKEVESDFAFSPDGTRVAFVRGGELDIPGWQRNEGDLWVHSLANGREVPLTDTPGVVASEPKWSPDGTRVAVVLTRSVRHAEAPEYSGAKILYSWLERSPSDVAVVPAAGGELTKIAASAERESAPRWIDASRLVLQRVSQDVKTREIVVADAASGRGEVVYRDVDEEWWSLPGSSGAEPLPSSNGRWIAFLSDRDGWDHIYVVPSSGGEAIQVTSGKYEAWRPSWSPDSTRIGFDTNEGDHPGSRHLAVAQLGDDPAAAKITLLTKGRGTNIAPQWSPDGQRLVYQHTDPQNSVELFVIDAVDDNDGEAPLRLTDSFPSSIDRSELVEPELVWYSADDGQEVPAYLFVPRDLDRSREHPAIVWIHGDGTNQNYDGWHVQRNYAVYYSFHQYLVQKGYVVLAPDYRGSIGYGKAWRLGAYLEVGGKDYQDIPPAVDYLKTLGFVDTERVGVWGLSYGGFFTLLALTDKPKLFRCGVDVAGTIDYRMYYRDPYKSAWTVGRMGLPEENPETYDVAAPIDRVDRIERPLLVLHGTSDVNVPYLHSVRLIDRLLELGKDVEFMMYAGEFHYFHRAYVLRDAWRRVERFFDLHLRTS